MREMNFSDLLRRSAERVGSKTALTMAATGEELTYVELDTEVDRVAAGLQTFGLSSGDRVALALGNIPHFIFSYLGVLRAGGVVVPLNIMLTAKEMQRVLADSGARFVIAAPPFAGTAKEAAKGTDVERLISTVEWDVFPIGGTPGPVETVPDDLAVLAYTSGTTGQPKGAMLSHGNLLANLDQQMQVPEGAVTEDDVLFLTLPFFHIFGLNVPLGLLILNGASGVLVERFEPVEALRLIAQYRTSVLFGAPPMYTAWVNTPGGDQYDLSSVRLAVSGAAPLPDEVLRSFKDTFGVQIYEGYGMTETAPTLTTNRMTEEPRVGSVGRPLPGVELRILNEEGQDVEFGDPGEIIVRGPNVFKGYWKRDEESAKSFTDGWFRTGDIGVRDEDGYIYLVDRKRDLIIVSGFNVFPSEVEAALVENPIIAEAAVIGEKHPYTGEAVKAYVVLNEGETATEAELIADVESRLARFKCPHAIQIVETLPHLLTGKVLRRALRT